MRTAASQAEDDVLWERERQIDQEKWSEAHDDEHEAGELALAGAAYAVAAANYLQPWPPLNHIVVRLWPFAQSWLKPKDQRRDLVRAAALIIAEIERIDRKTSQQSKGA